MRDIRRLLWCGWTHNDEVAGPCATHHPGLLTQREEQPLPYYPTPFCGGQEPVTSTC